MLPHVLQIPRSFQVQHWEIENPSRQVLPMTSTLWVAQRAECVLKAPLYLQEGGFALRLESQDERTFFYRGSFQVQQRMITYDFTEVVEGFCACRKVSWCTWYWLLARYHILWHNCPKPAWLSANPDSTLWEADLHCHDMNMQPLRISKITYA